MSVPAQALLQCQVGAETTYGTAVPANRQLSSISISLQPEFQGRELFTRIGSLLPTGFLPGIELARGNLEGVVSFTELPYVFSMLLGSVSPTQLMDESTETGAYRWIWQPAATAFTMPRSLTVETGVPGHQPQRAAGVVLTGLELQLEPFRAQVSGDVVGRRIENIANFTANPSLVAPVPPDFLRSEVRVATSLAGLDSATPLGAAFRFRFQTGTRLQRESPLGLQQQYIVPAAHEPRVELTLAANTEGVAELNRLRTNEIAYVRVVLEGPVIYSAGSTTYRHRLQLDLAVYHLQWQVGASGAVAVFEFSGGCIVRSDLAGYAVTLTTTTQAL